MAAGTRGDARGGGPGDGGEDGGGCGGAGAEGAVAAGLGEEGLRWWPTRRFRREARLPAHRLSGARAAISYEVVTR